MAVGGNYWQSLWLNRKLKALYYDKYPLNFHIVNYVNKPSNLPHTSTFNLFSLADGI